MKHFSYVCIMISLLLVICVFLSGCSDSDKSGADETTKASEQQTTDNTTTDNVTSGLPVVTETTEATVSTEQNTASTGDTVITTDDTLPEVTSETADQETTGETTEEETTEAEEMNTTPNPVDILTISGKNISEFKVICAEDASATVQKAASELCSYIGKAYGTAPERGSESFVSASEIVVGTTLRDTDTVKAKRDNLGDEGYLIYAADGRLYITGKTDRGTLYGVYSFLEDYIGCRFYTKDFERIVEKHEIDIPSDIDVSYVPAFEYRDCYWFDAFDAGFSAKKKINSCVSRSLGSEYGGGVAYAGQFVHTLAQLAEMSDRSIGSQPCLADENVYTTVLKNVRSWLRANPDARIISVSQNDSYPDQKGCQCEKCRAYNEAHGSEMATLLTFVNRIANDIKDDYPDVKVDTLAYYYTIKPPVDIVPADNVIIRLCSILCCYCHPFDTCDCAESKDFTSYIKEWANICDTLYVWDYNTVFTSYNSPFPNLKVLWQDYRFMRENHVVGVFEEGNYQSTNGEFCELRAYLVAKLLWNPDMSEDKYYAYMDDFLEGYYGEGWRYIREYIDSTSERAAATGHMKIFDSATTYLKFRKSQSDYMNSMIALFDSAYDEAETDEIKAHIEKSSIQMRYADMCLKSTKETADTAEQFYDLLVKYGITMMTEARRLEKPDFSTKRVSEW